MANLEPKAFDGMALKIVALPLKGPQGEQGPDGNRGDPGKTNYQLWLEAGNEGSLEDFLEAQKGADGEDGRPMVSRGRWEIGVYNPGEFVVAQGTATTSSLWFVIGDMQIISNVPPRLEAAGVWSQAPLPAGEPGTKWVILEGPPDMGDGDVGDYYLNIDTGNIYGPKVESGWGPIIGNLKGEDSQVLSVNGFIGEVELTPEDIGAATAAQGQLAESALQSDDVAPVAISGSYVDLANKPVLGSASSKNENYFVVSEALGVTVAQLVNGVVPASQLPSYVDDVLEFANIGAFPATGEKGKIYVTEDTNLTYRWTGSAYVEISKSPGSTDSVTEGLTNLYFTNARAAAAAPVQSVNNKTGSFSLTASDVGAQPVSTALTNLASVSNSAGGRALLNASGAANTLPYFSAANTVAAAAITPFGRSLIDDADAAAARATLGAAALVGAETFSGVKTFDTGSMWLLSTFGSIRQSVGGTSPALIFHNGDPAGGQASQYRSEIRGNSNGMTMLWNSTAGAGAGGAGVNWTDTYYAPNVDAAMGLGASTKKWTTVHSNTYQVYDQVMFSTTAARDQTKRNLGLAITVSAAAPTTPQEGDVWIDIS